MRRETTPSVEDLVADTLLKRPRPEDTSWVKSSLASTTTTRNIAPPAAEGSLPDSLKRRLNAVNPRSVEQFTSEDIARYSFSTLVAYSTARFIKIIQPYYMNNFDLNIIGHDVSLTHQQRLALSFGLKFIPPCRQLSPHARVDDVLMLGRRMLLRLIHGQSTPLQWYDTWKPGPESALDKFTISRIQARDKVAPQFQSLVQQIVAATRLAASRTHFVFSSLNRTPPLASFFEQVIRNVRQRSDIVITPADKNLGICVASRSTYLKYLALELGDVTTYKQEPCNLQQMCAEVHDLIKKLNRVHGTVNFKPMYPHIVEYVQKQVNEVLTHLTDDTRPPRAIPIYLLWKVHKASLSTRPISPVLSYPTTALNKIIDRWLQPAMKAAGSYVRDSSHFQELVATVNASGRINASTLLIAGDIQALYPNVDTSDEAIDAVVTYACKVHVDSNGLQPSVADKLAVFLKEALRYVLDNHYIQGPDGLTYRQISGLSMGASPAPPFACIWLHLMETPLLQKYADQLTLYRRFIDDLAIVWSGTYLEATNFCSEFNKLDKRKRMKVPTWSIKYDDMVFLDLTVKNYGNKLGFDLYVKPTNKGLYLPFSSHHQTPTFEAWVRAELCRRIQKCSLIDNQIQHCTTLITALTLRGYSLQGCLTALRDAIHLICTRKSADRPPPVPHDPWMEAPHIEQDATDPTPATLYPLTTQYTCPTDRAWAEEVKAIFGPLANQVTEGDGRVLVAFNNSPSIFKQVRPKFFTTVDADIFATMRENKEH